MHPYNVYSSTTEYIVQVQTNAQDDLLWLRAIKRILVCAQANPFFPQWAGYSLLCLSQWVVSVGSLCLSR